MEIKTFKQAEKAIRTDEGSETFGAFSMLPTEVLAKIATGEIDAKALAAAYMAARGFDKSGKWIGFDKAAEYWGKPSKG